MASQRQIFLEAIKWCVLVGLIVWIFRSVDSNDWRRVFSSGNRWHLLLLAFGLLSVAHLVSFLRWYFFIRALGIPFTVLSALRLGFLGNLFNFVSFGSVGGDLFKAIAAAKNAPDKRPEVVGSIFVDRVIGLLGLLIVAAVGLSFLGVDTDRPVFVTIRSAAWICVGVGSAGLLFLIYGRSWSSMDWLERLPKIGDKLLRMSRAATVFQQRPWLVVGMLSMSCVVHSFLTLAVFETSKAIYDDSPTVSEHFAVVPPAFAAAALPITPGGIGVQEMAIGTLFSELPRSSDDFNGFAVAAIFRIMLIFFAAIGGVYYAFGAKDLRVTEPPQNDLNSG